MKFFLKKLRGKPENIASSNIQPQSSAQQPPPQREKNTHFMEQHLTACIDYIEWIVMIGLIIFSLVYFFNALQKPMNATQWQMVQRYSENTLYPDTQIYAKALILHSKASQYDYLRLMHKVHSEHRNIRFQNNEKSVS